MGKFMDHLMFGRAELEMARENLGQLMSAVV